MDSLVCFGSLSIKNRCLCGYFDTSDRKLPLDSGKVLALREFIEKQVPHGLKKNEEWHKCVDAIHTHITRDFKRR